MKKSSIIIIILAAAAIYYLESTSSKQQIFASDYENWPFTINQGYLDCYKGRVTIEMAGVLYFVNEEARKISNTRPVERILKEDAQGLEQVIAAGLKICDSKIGW